MFPSVAQETIDREIKNFEPMKKAIEKLYEYEQKDIPMKIIIDEEMLIEHWKDEIEYLEDRLKEFQEISRKIKVTRCEGEGQGSCKRCIDKGTWNQMWMSSLYKIEGLEGCYCAKCVDEIMKEMK